MNVNGMSYRQWQKRNTNAFNRLTKVEQQAARRMDYRNVGWQQVQQSWDILQQWIEPATPSLFSAKLKKGNLTGAIDQSILEAEQAQKTAQQAVKNLNRKRSQIDQLAEETLNKYQLL